MDSGSDSSIIQSLSMVLIGDGVTSTPFSAAKISLSSLFDAKSLAKKSLQFSK